MQGYTSVSFICDEKNYWNQEATTIAYGFDRLYAGMEGDRERKYADENLFKTSLSTMQKMKTPFYAQLVTLSSHEPYMEPSLLDTPLIQEKFVNDEIKNYLIAIQLVDIRIMEFIDGLKKEVFQRHQLQHQTIVGGLRLFACALQLDVVQDVFCGHLQYI